MDTTNDTTDRKPRSLQSLDGQSVLVTPTHSAHNPPAGVRGTISVHSKNSDPASAPRAEVVFTLPDMVTAPARKVVVPLSANEIERLLRVEHAGDLTFRYEGQLG